MWSIKATQRKGELDNDDGFWNGIWQHLDDHFLDTIHIQGIDGIPWSCKWLRDGNCLRIEKHENQSGRLFIQYPFDDFGAMVVSTGTLPESPIPYLLDLELVGSLQHQGLHGVGHRVAVLPPLERHGVVEAAVEPGDRAGRGVSTPLGVVPPAGDVAEPLERGHRTARAQCLVERPRVGGHLGQVAQQPLGRQFRPLAPTADVVDNLVPRVVGNPTSVQSSPSSNRRGPKRKTRGI